MPGTVSGSCPRSSGHEVRHDRRKLLGLIVMDVVARILDPATVAALVNIVPRLLAAQPGLRLMTELPLPSWVNPQR